MGNGSDTVNEVGQPICMPLDMLTPGRRVLVTTDNWFYGPDGRQYRAIYGTVAGVFTDQETLGVRTNARSTNWYARIGGVVVAGCQVHYVVAASQPPPDTASDFVIDGGKYVAFQRPSCCLNADALPDVVDAAH